jgi:hypothetical protein
MSRNKLLLIAKGTAFGLLLFVAWVMAIGAVVFAILTLPYWLPFGVVAIFVAAGIRWTFEKARAGPL